MLLSLTQWLQTLYPEWGFLRVFQYLTFRAVMGAATALLIGLAAGPSVIRRLQSLKLGQPIRGYGMESHLSKSGTPTMGGVLILIAIASSTLLWVDLSNRFGKPSTPVIKSSCIVIVEVPTAVEGEHQNMGVVVDSVLDLGQVAPKT